MNHSSVKERVTCSPKIYVASLAAYSAGELHGVWIDAIQEKDEVMEEIKEMILSCPEQGEDWQIHDEEGFFGYELLNKDIEEICKIAKGIEKFGEDAEVFMELYDSYVYSVEEASRYMEEMLIGKYSHREDFIYEYVENSGILADACNTVKSYFNYEKFFSDILIDGSIFEIVVKYRKHYFFHNS